MQNVTTIEDYREQITGKPEYFAYWGDLDLDVWGTMLSVHRDSDTLDRSNWEVISEDMTTRFEEDVTIESASHFLVGWVEKLQVNTANPDALEAAYEWYLKLQDYPVADEEHFFNLEFEEREEYYQNGGKEDALDEIRDSEEFAHIFTDEDETKPELEDYINRAFHDAEIYGSLSCFPETLEEQLNLYREDRRHEFEQYQPPLENS